MNIIESLLLGIIQGLTEFLPVSSSGHLVLAQHFFGIQDNEGTLFEVFLHLGTLLAVLIYFRNRILELTASVFQWKNTLDSQNQRHNHTLVLYLIVSSIITAVFYLVFKDTLENLYNQPLIVALLLAVTGLIVFISDFIKSSDIPASQMGLIRSGLIGLIQGIAIIPGISRSGSTIAASLIVGIKRREAAEFSFLLSVPAILGANIINLKQFNQLRWSDIGHYLSGFVASFVIGYLVISFLIELISRAKLKYFSYYCWAISALAVIFVILGY